MSLTEDLSPAMVTAAIEAALAEDLGLAGDITSRAVLPENLESQAEFRARASGVVAGLDLAAAAFHTLDPTISFSRLKQDGDTVAAGDVLARVAGKARAILAAERVALNFLGHLSGIATLTRDYVTAITGTRAHICCTRKTTPGLRAFEKYAVRQGGGVNHRFSLADAVLIKDNHIAMAGGVREALARAKAQAGHMVKIEIEVEDLAQLDDVLAMGVDAVLLDNMPLETLHEAVRRIGGRAIAEASGGITLANVRAVAETGVDLISVGALTHSAPTLDIGLDYLPSAL